MTASISLPQARIPLGWATVQGVRVPVEIDMEWMLVLTGMLERTGGISGDTNFNEYINQFFDAPLASAESQENTRAIEELRGEIESTRGDLKRLRDEFEQWQNEPRTTDTRTPDPQEEPRIPADFRNRLELLEDRLA